jgi:hypothetical protein
MDQSAPLFGVVIPGRHIITDFKLVDNTKAVTLIQQPASIAELTFFLLPNTPIPDGYGAILYYSVPPFENWILLGAVYPSKPSGIFRTTWTTNEEVRNMPVAQLGVSIEPLVYLLLLNTHNVYSIYLFIIIFF